VYELHLLIVLAIAIPQVGFSVGPQPTNNSHLFPSSVPTDSATLPVAHPVAPRLHPAASMSLQPDADELEHEPQRSGSAAASSSASASAAQTAGASSTLPRAGSSAGNVVTPAPGSDASGPAAASALASSTQRVKRNWLIHQLYIRQEFAECLKVIESQLAECKGLAEYPLYVKALIRRQQGCINESLQLFQAATVLNPHNIANLKQVGRSLYLSGKHKQAIDVYEEAQRIGIDDWEVWHNKGLCHLYLKSYNQACDDFKAANAIQRHDATYMVRCSE
jgi:tetratricopeptide (TPR) repeat protein